MREKLKLERLRDLLALQRAHLRSERREREGWGVREERERKKERERENLELERLRYILALERGHLSG